MPEKGKVTIGHFTGKVARGKMQRKRSIKFVTNSFGWSSFKGSFRHGQLVGTGSLEYDDGVVYEGESFPFLPGTSSSSVVKVAIHAEAEDGKLGFTGERTGHFSDGVIHGTARGKFSNMCTYKGLWRHYSCHGKGMFVRRSDNSVMRYTGTFVDNDFREGSFKDRPPILEKRHITKTEHLCEGPTDSGMGQES